MAPFREYLTPFLAFPPELRRVVYTTNAIEALNGSYGKRSRRKDTSPTRRPPANSSTSPSPTPCRRGRERGTGRQPCSRSRSTSATAYPSEPPTQKIGRPPAVSSFERRQ